MFPFYGGPSGSPEFLNVYVTDGENTEVPPHEKYLVSRCIDFESENFEL